LFGSKTCTGSAQNAKRIVEEEENLEFISGKVFRCATCVVRSLFWRNLKMIDDFETVTLSYGHSLNSYKGFGICQKCWKKNCGQYLTLVDDLLLCPQCFKERRENSS
jgi:hypothetical protein